jgi:hypothetical protein
MAVRIIDATTMDDVKRFRPIRGSGRNLRARGPQTDAEGKKAPRCAR